MVENGSIFVTDEHTGYNGLDKDFEHIKVNHKRHEYVNGNFSTNNVENFWSHLSRGLYGIYHHCQPKHLHRYCEEFSYRMNTRKLPQGERFKLALTKTENSRLSYQKLIEKPQ